jgi:phosphonate transport system substrate-binding protein
MGPVAYLHMVSQVGKKPLLARFEVNDQPNLYGVIAVRKDSELKDLKSLANKRFAFGDPESTMSHTVPRYLLLKVGIAKGLPAQHRFLGTHKNVALGVLVGDFDAGAMKQEVFDEFAPRGLRALAVTPGVPDHLFVTRANLPGADVERLRRALLRLKDQPDGPAILGKLHKGLTALVPATDADYAALRDMVRAVDAAGR